MVELCLSAVGTVNAGASANRGQSFRMFSAYINCLSGLNNVTVRLALPASNAFHCEGQSNLLKQRQEYNWALHPC